MKVLSILYNIITYLILYYYFIFVAFFKLSCYLKVRDKVLNKRNKLKQSGLPTKLISSIVIVATLFLSFLAVEYASRVASVVINKIFILIK